MTKTRAASSSAHESSKAEIEAAKSLWRAVVGDPDARMRGPLPDKIVRDLIEHKRSLKRVLIEALRPE